MALFAEVAVEAARALDRQTYSYAVPDGLDVVPGHRVTVPFGRRNTYGFVVSLGTAGKTARSGRNLRTCLRGKASRGETSRLA